MARIRTTKKLAQRIDLNYFKRPTAYKRAKLWLCLLATLLAFLWIAGRTALKDHRVYSSGRLSETHAVLEKECATCHMQTVLTFSAKADDSACLACHDGPPHHASQIQPLHCAQCHREHRGHVNLRAASNQSCAECHGDLRAAGGTSNFANAIHSFAQGHPQFAALREAARDPGTLKLNHAMHMKPIRRGPNGPIVNLDCGDCHRPAVMKAEWKYSDANYAAAKNSYADKAENVSLKSGTFQPSRLESGREVMAPVKFATACASCHLLSYDTRFDDGVPHDTPTVVHAFLIKKFAAYIAAHQSELREQRDPDRELSGRQTIQRNQALNAAQWVAQRTAVAEELLWHKTCAQCHALTGADLQDTSLGRWSSTQAGDTSRSAARVVSAAQVATVANGTALPVVAPSKAITQWMPHAKFDHDAHRGFTCEGCHQKALSSTDSSDVLMPGIATCQTCHAPGPDHTESRCFECHTYHDWAKRKEIKPGFTLPALRKLGR